MVHFLFLATLSNVDVQKCTRITIALAKLESSEKSLEINDEKYISHIIILHASTNSSSHIRQKFIVFLL